MHFSQGVGFFLNNFIAQDIFFSLCHILSVLFVFAFFSHNYKFKFREACLWLEKQNNKAFILFATWSRWIRPGNYWVGLVWRDRQELSCKSKIYTMKGTVLGLVVLNGENGILDKITICWWRLWKRCPCKFLNKCKLVLENSKVFYRPKREWA